MAKFNLKERAAVVRAMETIARCINDEDIFMGWLMNGVADGDINKDTTDEDLDWYCEDDNFADLMACFLRRMVGASKSGGLYCNGVVAVSEEDDDE